MRRYQLADANLHGHIKTLRLICTALAICLAIALFGWHYASRVQRVSLPPDLRYGSQILVNQIHPWEVYNFAGYIWQQLNRCAIDCFKDYPENLDRLSAFLTPAFRAWLEHDNSKRSTELLGRTRYILPMVETDFNRSVIQEKSGNWTVIMEVELKEDIGGVPVKNVQMRYFLRVVAKDVDPEFNPWGLLLDTMPRLPERISTTQT